MGLLSFLRKLVDGGGTAEDKMVRAELEQVRALAEGGGGSMVEGVQEGDRAPLGPKLRRRYRFSGMVQGVGFRFTITNLANAAGATGWVRNEHDGTVTAEIQGIVEQIDAVIAGLDRYYNRRTFMGGFTIADVRDLPLVADELEFSPRN